MSSNPFEALNISDDEEDRIHTNKSNVEKTRKSICYSKFSSQGEKGTQKAR